MFDYPAKGGTRRVHVIEDPMTHDLLSALKRRRGAGPELLSYRENRAWRPLRAEDINDYLKAKLGEEFSAKDFRTWTGTKLASEALDECGPATSSRQAMRNIKNVVEQVSDTGKHCGRVQEVLHTSGSV